MLEGTQRGPGGAWGRLGLTEPCRRFPDFHPTGNVLLPTGNIPSHRECCILQGMLHPTGNVLRPTGNVSSHRESCCCLLIRAHFGCPHLAVPTLLSPSSAALPQEIPEMLLHPGAGAVTQGMQLHILASPGQVFPEDFVSHMGMNHTGDSHADPRAWDNQSHLFKGRFPAQPSGKEFD